MSNLSSTAAPVSHGSLKDYVRIARIDHSVKHIFILPGIVLAYLLRGCHSASLPLSLTLGLLAAFLIASGNYVVNEYLDREFDKHHPTKSARAAVQKVLDPRLVAAEWGLLVMTGLICAGVASSAMFLAACLFALQGVVYNVPPLRTKNKAYLDVVSEAVNNPLRLIIGWAMIDPSTLPPSSIIMAYWLGGAFLMGAKRLSEHREIVASHGRELLVRYRASFSGYSEESLVISCFVYALLSSFFLAIFLIKYRVEYLLLFPVIVMLFGHYLRISMKAGSSAQKPETLYHERTLMILVLTLVITFTITTAVNIPLLSIFASQRYISLP
jgi:4-hydroxybenzoate polyprenyltransferase